RVALAGAALEVAQLQIKVAEVLPPDHRKRLVGRDAVLAVAGSARRGLVFDRLRVRQRRDGEQHNREYGASARRHQHVSHPPQPSGSFFTTGDAGFPSSQKKTGPWSRLCGQLVGPAGVQSVVNAIRVLPRLESI